MSQHYSVNLYLKADEISPLITSYIKPYTYALKTAFSPSNLHFQTLTNILKCLYIYIITYNDSMISKPIRGRCPDDNESLK